MILLLQVFLVLISDRIWISELNPNLMISWINLSGITNTIITWFGNPYAIDKIKSLQNADGLDPCLSGE